MTNSAKWIALLNVSALLASLIDQHSQLAILSLLFLLVMLSSYLVFRFRCWQLRRGCKVQRFVQENDAPTGYLWGGRSYQVQVKLTSRGGFPAGTTVRDVLPEILEQVPRNPPAISTPPTAPTKSRSLHAYIERWLTAVEPERIYTLSQAPAKHGLNTCRLASPQRDVLLQYNVRPRGAGLAILPGVRVEYVDPFHWFRWDALLPCEQTVTILPNYHKGAELRSLLKSSNAIPHHGIHRQRKPGMGFELLELREYQDGDPPKSIAWKASARREHLMTRQYESEVPIRVNLIIEGTRHTRVGSFGLRTLDQVNSVATSLSHIAATNGDWVGAFLIDDHDCQQVHTATGNKGFHQIAQALAEFSARRFPKHVRWTEEMQDAAFALASEAYPKLLHQKMNPTSYTFWTWRLPRVRRRHVQLANLLAYRYQLNVLQHAELLADTYIFATQLQRFLCEHGRAWVTPMIPESEVIRTMRPTGWKSVTQSLQRAVLHAKDNEVFVLFVDLLAIDRPISSLLEVCRMAKGRRHRIVVISTSPYFQKPEPETVSVEASSAVVLRAQSEQIRVTEQANEARRAFRELGIPCAFSSTLETIPWVLAEVELARSGRHSRTGTLH